MRVRVILAAGVVLLVLAAYWAMRSGAQGGSAADPLSALTKDWTDVEFVHIGPREPPHFTLTQEQQSVVAATLYSATVFRLKEKGFVYGDVVITTRMGDKISLHVFKIPTVITTQKDGVEVDLDLPATEHRALMDMLKQLVKSRRGGDDAPP